MIKVQNTTGAYADGAHADVLTGALSKQNPFQI